MAHPCCDYYPCDNEKYCCFFCYAWSLNGIHEQCCCCWILGGWNQENTDNVKDVWCCLGPCAICYNEHEKGRFGKKSVEKTLEVYSVCTCIRMVHKNEKTDMHVAGPCCGFKNRIEDSSVSGAAKESIIYRPEDPSNITN